MAQILMIDKKDDKLLVEMSIDEFAQISGFTDKHRDDFAETMKKDRYRHIPIGSLFEQAKGIVNAVPDIITAIRTIKSGAGKLEKAIEPPKEKE